MYYSLVGRDLEHEIVPFAIDAGVGITVWSPLASGFLSGKYTREDPTGGGGRLNNFDFIPFDREKGYALIAVLKEMAVTYGATPAQLAIAWLLSRRYVSSVLIGASRASQLDDNLKAAKVSLSESELARLDELTAPKAPYPNWFNQRMVDGVVKDALA
jgi:aryl-alcohol dehydrogenase-like predicted oxidoreductase